MWGQLFKTFAQQWMAEQVRSTAKAAVDQATNPQAVENSAMSPCHAGVQFALGIEAGSLEDQLTGKMKLAGDGFSVQVGQLAKHKVAILQSGVGLPAAERGIVALIAGHQPSWVISAGFAGGLQPEIQRGELVLGNEIISPTGERLQINVQGAPPGPDGVPVHLGPIFTSERILKTTAEKSAAGKQHSALAVDMETWVIAQHCAKVGQKFLAVRVISDALDQELPADVDKLIEQQSSARRAGRILGSLVRRPSIAKELWNLQETAWLCADRLSKFVQVLLRELP